MLSLPPMTFTSDSSDRLQMIRCLQSPCCLIHHQDSCSIEYLSMFCYSYIMVLHYTGFLYVLHILGMFHDCIYIQPIIIFYFLEHIIPAFYVYSTFAHTFAYVLRLRITPNKISYTMLFSPIRIHNFHFTPNCKPFGLKLHFFRYS